MEARSAARATRRPSGSWRAVAPPSIEARLAGIVVASVPVLVRIGDTHPDPEPYRYMRPARLARRIGPALTDAVHVPDPDVAVAPDGHEGPAGGGEGDPRQTRRPAIQD